MFLIFLIEILNKKITLFQIKDVYNMDLLTQQKMSYKYIISLFIVHKEKKAQEYIINFKKEKDFYFQFNLTEEANYLN